MSEFAAQIDAATGRMMWPVERWGRNEAGEYVRRGDTMAPLCPCFNPAHWHRQQIAELFGVKVSQVVRMEMIRIGKTDRLGDAGWKVVILG